MSVHTLLGPKELALELIIMSLDKFHDFAGAAHAESASEQANTALSSVVFSAKCWVLKVFMLRPL